MRGSGVIRARLVPVPVVTKALFGGAVRFQVLVTCPVPLDVLVIVCADLELGQTIEIHLAVLEGDAHGAPIRPLPAPRSSHEKLFRGGENVAVGVPEEPPELVIWIVQERMALHHGESLVVRDIVPHFAVTLLDDRIYRGATIIDVYLAELTAQERVDVGVRSNDAVPACAAQGNRDEVSGKCRFKTGCRVLDPGGKLCAESTGVGHREKLRLVVNGSIEGGPESLFERVLEITQGGLQFADIDQVGLGGAIGGENTTINGRTCGQKRPTRRFEGPDRSSCCGEDIPARREPWYESQACEECVDYRGFQRVLGGFRWRSRGSDDLCNFGRRL